MFVWNCKLLFVECGVGCFDGCMYLVGCGVVWMVVVCD